MCDKLFDIKGETVDQALSSADVLVETEIISHMDDRLQSTLADCSDILSSTSDDAVKMKEMFNTADYRLVVYDGDSQDGRSRQATGERLNNGCTITENLLVDGQVIRLSDGTTAIVQKYSEGFQLVELNDDAAYCSHLLYSSTPAADARDDSRIDLQLYQQDAAENQVDYIDCSENFSLEQVIGEDMNTVEDETSSQQRGVPIELKGYPCTYEGCGRYYTTPHHLKVHVRSHTGDRPFCCDSQGCSKTFTTSYGLKTHLRVHSGEKPYECPYLSLEPPCLKAFKTSGDLQKHLRTHTGSKPFVCQIASCAQSFTTSNIRKIHMRTHTGERPYICAESGCGKTFSSTTNYKNHIRIHSGEKPYACSVEGCNKRFTEYSSLYKHHVVHTQDKPYPCGRCGKTYRQTSTLSMHRRMAHVEDVHECGASSDICDRLDEESLPMINNHDESVIGIFLPRSDDHPSQIQTLLSSFQVMDSESQRQPSRCHDDTDDNLIIDTDQNATTQQITPAPAECELSLSGPTTTQVPSSSSSSSLHNGLRLKVETEGGKALRGKIYLCYN